MDGAEKLLSISQGQMTVVYSVTVFRIFSGTDMIKISRLLEVLYNLVAPA